MRCRAMRMPSLVQRAARRVLGFRHGGKAPLQVGALPYRRRVSGEVEVMLVTTRSAGRWIIPKGWPMSGKTLAEAAQQEAFEEAGVRGRIDPLEIGRFPHAKDHILAGAITTEVVVFPLAVAEELPVWPERHERTRAWFGLATAAEAVGPGALADIIGSADKFD